ncbi:MAG: LON peptidase substrate-binding domain-containing protein [Rhodovibrionaceae bacterium]
MPRSPFDPRYEDLPGEIPIFPLTGVLLLPGGGLPLNIFETRYLAMVRDALASPSRLIGMVQPSLEVEVESPAGTPKIYGTGCAGRIAAFQETQDQRYMITLTGLLRFDIQAELPDREGYRRVVPDWSRYRGDLEEDAETIDRGRLIGALRAYFEAEGVSGDLESLQDNSDEKLVALLAMHCPFEPREKQALLEAPNLKARAEAISAIMEMAALNSGGAGAEQTSRH